MTDAELRMFLGLSREEAKVYIPKLTQQKRAECKRMYESGIKPQSKRWVL